MNDRFAPSSEVSAESDGKKTAEPPKLEVVLCLQGGGARAAFQVGVYQALLECKLDVDWVIGVSSGAVNAAVIAGNRKEHRLERLELLWKKIWRAPGDMSKHAKTLDELRFWKGAEAMMTVFGKPNFYSLNSGSAFLNPFASTSFYDQSELRTALSRVVDFKVINETSSPRMSAGTTDICNSELCFFDNRRNIVFSPADAALHWGDVTVIDPGGQSGTLVGEEDPPEGTALTADHILAAAAYPPGAQAVVLGDRLCWDAGVVANSPLDAVMEDVRKDGPRNILLLLIDLWNPIAPPPSNIIETIWRKMEIEHVSHIPAALQRMQLNFPNQSRADVLHLTYVYDKQVTGIDTLDFSLASVEDRIQLGRVQTRAAIENWQLGLQAPERAATGVEIRHYHQGQLRRVYPAKRVAKPRQRPDSTVPEPRRRTGARSTPRA